MFDLYFAQNRFYNPDTRQFITQDPIKDGMNWYVYCDANPLVRVDWLGLKPVSIRSYVESRGGEVSRLYYDDFFNAVSVTFILNNRAISVTMSGENSHELAVKNVGDSLFAHDYDLQNFFYHGNTGTNTATVNNKPTIGGSIDYNQLAKQYGSLSYNSRQELLNADLVNLLARTIYAEQTQVRDQGQEAVAWVIANRVLAQRSQEFAGGNPTSIYSVLTAPRQFTCLEGEGGNEHVFMSKTEEFIGWEGWVNAVKLAHGIVDVFEKYYVVGEVLTAEKTELIRKELTTQIGANPIGDTTYWYLADYQFDKYHIRVGNQQYYNGKPIEYIGDKNRNIFFNYQ